jgi:hypothetical protein
VDALDCYARDRYTKLNIKTNCRNTKRIAGEIQHLTGLGGTKLSDKSPDGNEVEFIQWQEGDFNALNKKIGELLDSGIKAEDIIVLRALNKQAADPIPNDKIKNIIDKRVVTSSVGKYKGLESKVVILYDVDTYDNKNLIYQGMSRAITMLIIFESEKARKERTNQ